MRPALDSDQHPASHQGVCGAEADHMRLAHAVLWEGVRAIPQPGSTTPSRILLVPARVEDGVRPMPFHLDHRFVRRRLSAYLDGELAKSQRQRVERHLVECENCERTRRALVRLLVGLRRLGASPRRDVARGAVERLRAEEIPGAGRPGPLT